MTEENINGVYTETLDFLNNSVVDKNKTLTEKYAEQIDKIQEEFIRRNDKLTELFTNFIEQQNTRSKENKCMKKFLFFIFCFLLLGLTVAIVIVFIKTDFSKVDVPSVVSLFSVGATYFGSVISILKIMSVYLFPLEEERNTIDMIKTVIDNDAKLEQTLSAHVERSRYVHLNTLTKYKKMLDEEVISVEEYDEIKKHYLSQLYSYNEDEEP